MRRCRPTAYWRTARFDPPTVCVAVITAIAAPVRFGYLDHREDRNCQEGGHGEDPFGHILGARAA